MRAKIGLARTASGKESERPAPLGRQAAEIHAKAAADQVRRAEQLCADCGRGARSDALAATRPTVWGEGAVYRLAHASAKTLPAPPPARVREQRIALISRKPCPRPSRGASVHPTVPRSRIPAVLRSRPIPVQNASRRAKSGKLQSVVLRSDPGVGNRILTAHNMPDRLGVCTLLWGIELSPEQTGGG